MKLAIKDLSAGSALDQTAMTAGRGGFIVRGGGGWPFPPELQFPPYIEGFSGPLLPGFRPPPPPGTVQPD